ncbi:MAG: cobalt-precorrin 5A hydrolase [Anaerofustis sp.]
MNIAIVSFTAAGAQLSVKTSEILRNAGHRTELYSTKELSAIYNITAFHPDIRTWTGDHFCTEDALLFIGACGIAVRAIAPWVKGKDKDPAVIVLDEAAKFVIPILSGHIGGANELSRKLAVWLSSTAVITTASDVNAKFAVDEWAVNHGMHIVNIKGIKAITAALLKGTSVGLRSVLPIDGNLPEGIEFLQSEECGICISYNKDDKPFRQTLNLIPKNIVIGVGCKKGTSGIAVETAVLAELDKAGLPIESAAKVCSVDLKKEEAGILAFCEKYAIPFETYSADELNRTPGDYPPSDFVHSITGTDNVCQRAAAAGSQNGTIISEKQCYDGVTVALAKAFGRIKF